ncbi:hypothetical protein Pelo_17790 [Pelomyxa schiedti]|nr:hypothetical protein Pelo_17790 [Pelomyxa schiedti]
MDSPPLAPEWHIKHRSLKQNFCQQQPAYHATPPYGNSGFCPPVDAHGRLTRTRSSPSFSSKERDNGGEFRFQPTQPARQPLPSTPEMSPLQGQPVKHPPSSSFGALPQRNKSSPLLRGTPLLTPSNVPTRCPSPPLHHLQSASSSVPPLATCITAHVPPAHSPSIAVTPPGASLGAFGGALSKTKSISSPSLTTPLRHVSNTVFISTTRTPSSAPTTPPLTPTSSSCKNLNSFRLNGAASTATPSPASTSSHATSNGHAVNGISNANNWPSLPQKNKQQAFVPSPQSTWLNGNNDSTKAADATKDKESFSIRVPGSNYVLLGRRKHKAPTVTPQPLVERACCSETEVELGEDEEKFLRALGWVSPMEESTTLVISENEIAEVQAKLAQLRLDSKEPEAPCNYQGGVKDK